MNDVRDTLSGQAGLLCELLTAAMEPQLKRTGMTLSTFELLSAVHSLRSKGTQADVARRLGITPPSLSEAVKGATRNGLLEQEPNPKDARTKILRITPQGTRALNAVIRSIREAEEAMLQGLSSDEATVAIRVLRKANKNLATGLQKT